MLGQEESIKRGNAPADPRGLPPGMHPAMADPLAQMVEDLAHNAQTLGMIFNEKTRREAEKTKHLPPDQQPLPDINDLKNVIDAQEKAIQAALAYRNEQRQSMVFAATHKRVAKEESRIGFGDHANPKPAIPGGP